MQTIVDEYIFFNYQYCSHVLFTFYVFIFMNIWKLFNIGQSTSNKVISILNTMSRNGVRRKEMSSFCSIAKCGHKKKHMVIPSHSYNFYTINQILIFI